MQITKLKEYKSIWNLKYRIYPYIPHNFYIKYLFERTTHGFEIWRMGKERATATVKINVSTK